MGPMVDPGPWWQSAALKECLSSWWVRAGKWQGKLLHEDVKVILWDPFFPPVNFLIEV